MIRGGLTGGETSLVTRELIVIARRTAVAVAALAVGVLLAAFVLLWAPGVPLLPELNLYQQTRLVHWLLLAAALPWVAARSALAERGDALVLAAALTARPPAEFDRSRTAALTVALALVVCCGFPGLVIAQQAAAIPLAIAIRDTLPLSGACLLIAALTTASTLWLSDRLSAWLLVTVVTMACWLLLWQSAATVAAAGALSAAIAVVVTGWVSTRANTSLLYLEDGDV